MIESTKAPVVPNYETAELEVPHLGITLRTLLAVAAEASKQRPLKRKWVIRYKTAEIGSIRIK